MFNGLKTPVVALLIGSGLVPPSIASAADAGASKGGVPSPSIATSLPPDVADPGGLRAALAAKGVTYQINYIGETLADVAGGLKRGGIYEGRLEFVLDADLEKLAGWNGLAFHANAFQIHGKGLSRNYVGNLMPVSSIEALPSTRLFEAWLEQKFNDQWALRFGQLAADTEFIISDYAGLFINGAFGWPALEATDLPSGGPAYPLATPGVRIKYNPSKATSFLLGVFNGDPAGPGSGDPQERDPFGLNFRVQDPPFVIGEAQFKYNQDKGAKGLPGTVKLGAWTHLGSFADLHFGVDALSLADPRSDQQPLLHRYNFGLYAVLDQQLYARPGGDAGKGVGVFVRASASPSDRNLIDFYLDAGLNFTGMIAARPDDSFGIAVAFARISSSARGLDQDRVFFSGVPTPIRDYEAALELTYQAQIVPGWTIQPDFQYIVHPGGNVANPLSANDTTPVRNAVVVGLRSTIKY